MAGLPKIFTLNRYPTAQSVLVLGCGGTGAYVVSHLARLINVLNQERRNDIKLFLADGDVVEEKNLKRQHFISSDINQNKASVLAERYAAVFGMEILVIPRDIEKLEEFNVLGNTRQRTDRSDLVIGCVDNNASRRLVYKWFIGEGEGQEENFAWRPRFWIDAGNEERAGQVICGYAPPSRGSYGSRKVKIDARLKDTVGEFSLPCVTECYPELMNEEDSKFNSELSCAERAESAPQNMQTNVTAATLAINYAQKIIMGEPLNSHGVEFTIDNTFATKLNTPENLRVVGETRKRYWEK